MIINFSSKIRKKVLIVFTLLTIILGGGIYLLKKDSTTETLKIQEDSINKYTMDVIFDDESKRMMCNQNLVYVNNTGIDLDKIYLHIYPNAFSKEEYAPFEKSEFKEAYPNGFNEGYIDIKNILSSGEKLNYNIEGDKNDILEIKTGS